MSRSRRSSVDLSAGVVPLSRRSSVDYSADVGQFSRRPSIDYSADVGQFSRRPSIDYSADVGQFSRRQSIDFGAGVGALGLPIRSPTSDSGFSTSVGTNSRRPSVDVSAGVGNAVSFCLWNILSLCISDGGQTLVLEHKICIVSLDFSLTVKASPRECEIRTSQP